MANEPLPTSDIAGAYLISRQHAHTLIKKHGRHVVSDPDRLFEVLLLEGRAGVLRQRLSNPFLRGLIAELLETIAASNAERKPRPSSSADQ